MSREGAGERTSVRWGVLGLLFLMAFLVYLQRTNLQVAADAMMPDLGIGLREMGWVFAAFSWAYALFQFPGGLLGVRFGFRVPVLLLGLSWALLTLLTGVLPGTVLRSTGAIVAGLVLLRFAFGVSQAPFFPLQGGMIEAWFPRNGWAFPNALIASGLGFGAAAASPLCAWLMERYGWRATFTAIAPLGLPLLALWWWYVRDHPAGHRGVSPAELELIRADRPPVQPAVAPGAWRRVLANRPVLLLTFSYFAMNYVYTMFFQWLFLYLVQERGFGTLQSGFLAALPWVTGSLTAAVGGWVCDALCARVGPRWGCRLPCLVALPLVGLFLLLGAWTPGPMLAVTCLTLCFGFVQFTDAVFWAGATYAAGPDTSAATGLLNTGGNLPGIVTGISVPLLIAHFGWTAALASGTVFALISAALWLVIDVEAPTSGTDEASALEEGLPPAPA